MTIQAGCIFAPRNGRLIHLPLLIRHSQASSSSQFIHTHARKHTALSPSFDLFIKLRWNHGRGRRRADDTRFSSSSSSTAPLYYGAPPSSQSFGSGGYDSQLYGATYGASPPSSAPPYDASPHSSVPLGPVACISFLLLLLFLLLSD